MTIISRQPASRIAPHAAALAVTATITYLAFAAVAYAKYPHAFSPQNNNWLSDLGNRDLNPSGAIYYRSGCTIAGALQAALFLSLAPWRRGGTTRQRRLVVWAQLFGLAAALALVMTAVFPEDRFDVHQLWSRALFSAFAGLLFVSMIAFRRPGMSNAALITTAAAGYVTIAGWLAFSSQHWLEWIAVALLLMFVCILGTRTTALCRRGCPARRGTSNGGPLT